MPAHRTFPSRTPWLTPGSARATAHRVRTRLRLSGTHADDGFTMIEVVVALTLFVIFSAAATMAVVNGVDAQAQTQGRVAAANIAQADLEQARSQATPASTSYATTPPGSTDSYSVTRTVTYPTANGTVCPTGDLIQIGVSVTWPGGKQAVQAATVLSC